MEAGRLALATADGYWVLKKEKPRWHVPTGLFVVFKRSCLQSLDVAGLGAFGTIRDLEGHPLALLQGLEAVT